MVTRGAFRSFNHDTRGCVHAGSRCVAGAFSENSMRASLGEVFPLL